MVSEQLISAQQPLKLNLGSFSTSIFYMYLKSVENTREMKYYKK